MPLPWPASAIKTAAIPKGRTPRRILFGPMAGLTLDLDLAHHTQLWFGLYEHEIGKWMARLSAAARSAIDVGAAEGVYSIYFMKKRPIEQVWAFEPSRSELAKFRQNLALNDLEGFAPSERIVGARDDDRDHATLDSLLTQLRFPCLVKVDVDGAEAAVLSGAQQLLSCPEVSWVIEIHSAELESECRSRLESAGYQVYVVRPAWWRWLIREERPIEVNHWLIGVREDRGLRRLGGSAGSASSSD
jgi:hypothetical protein